MNPGHRLPKFAGFASLLAGVVLAAIVAVSGLFVAAHFGFSFVGPLRVAQGSLPECLGAVSERPPALTQPEGRLPVDGYVKPDSAVQRGLADRKTQSLGGLAAALDGEKTWKWSALLMEPTGRCGSVSVSLQILYCTWQA